MRVETLPLSALVPYSGNAKIHTPEQVAQIAESIRQFGNNDPIAIDENNVIIEGHGRLLALQQLGYKEAEVIRLTHLTDEQKRAYILAHNQLTLNTGFDLDALKIELEQIETIDMADFGFLDSGNGSWFETRERYDNDLEDETDEYKDFVEKFEAKRTTDDCYTPDIVYDAIADYVAERYGLNRADFVRPFYPGGDYQNEKYKKGAVVVDNPPFSILSEIVGFYMEKSIPFFLFCEGRTCLALGRLGATVISLQVGVTYENGAVVSTSFVTNLENPDIFIKSDPEFYQIIKKADEENRHENNKEMPVFAYPINVCTSSMIGKYSKYGVEFSVPRSSSEFIREIESMKEAGKGIYGGGLLLSDKLAAARAEAEQAAAELAAAKQFDLSEAERGIVRRLSSTEFELSERERERVNRLNNKEGAET